VRCCAREKSNYLHNEFGVSGKVMSGSGLANVTASVHKQILRVTKHDVAALWSSSNDVNGAARMTSIRTKHQVDSTLERLLASKSQHQYKFHGTAAPRQHHGSTTAARLTADTVH
jgi:hypothetical protein